MKIKMYWILLFVVVFLILAGFTSASAQTTNSLSMAWTDSNPTGTSYTVFQANNSDCTGTPAFAQIATGLAAKNYTATGLAPNTSYCFEVQAVMGTQNAMSNTDTGKTAFQLVAPVLRVISNGATVVVNPN